MKKHNALWNDIKRDIKKHSDAITGLNETCQKLMATREWAEKKDWSKASEEETQAYLEKVKETQDYVVERFEEEEDFFGSACDRIEEVIYALSSYKKQNRLFEKEISEDIEKKSMFYAGYLKMMGSNAFHTFERSNDQIEQYHSRLSQWA